MWDFYWNVQLRVLWRRWEILFCFVGLVLRQYLPHYSRMTSNSGSSCSVSRVLEPQTYATTPTCTDPSLVGLYLIYYRGLDRSILQCTGVCLGLNTLQSLHGKLLSQDRGRSSLNQEMWSRGGQSWLTRCPWGQSQTRKPLRIAAVANGAKVFILFPVEVRRDRCWGMLNNTGNEQQRPHKRQPCHSFCDHSVRTLWAGGCRDIHFVSEAILYLEKDCKSDIRNSHLPFTQIPPHG